jgi:hypothetical protein
MPKFKDKDLLKGQLRTLKAMRKNLGADIADEAYAKYLATLPAKEEAKVDKNIQAMTDLVTPAVMDRSIKLPMKGFVVTRGRGRVIVKPVK